MQPENYKDVKGHGYCCVNYEAPYMIFVESLLVAFFSGLIADLMSSYMDPK